MTGRWQSLTLTLESCCSLPDRAFNREVLPPRGVQEAKSAGPAHRAVADTPLTGLDFADQSTFGNLHQIHPTSLRRTGKENALTIEVLCKNKAVEKCCHIPHGCLFYLS